MIREIYLSHTVRGFLFLLPVVLKASSIARQVEIRGFSGRVKIRHSPARKGGRKYTYSQLIRNAENRYRNLLKNAAYYVNNAFFFILYPDYVA